MNKIRWRILWAICLLLSAIPIATTGQVWASVSRQPQSTATQIQTVQAAVNLLLDDNEAQTDSGFRPNPHGYSFQNYGGVNGADLTVDDLRPIFGDNAVCAAKFSGICLHNRAAVEWRNRWVQIMNGGHCYGMAVTSSRYFAGVDQPVSLQANATSVYDLQLGNARRNIASYFVRQGANPVASNLRGSLNTTPNQVLEQIRNSFDSPSGSLTIAIFGPGAGHAVTPYRVEDRGNGIVWVLVYDNNHPNDANRPIEFNTTNNSWRYNLGWVTWSGNAATHSIGVVPYSLNNTLMQCPWCRNSSRSLATNDISQVWAVGNANVLVTDEAGRRFGRVGNDFLEEIPNAYQTVLMTGLPGPSPAIYNIPVNGTQTLLLNSSVITQPTSMTISQFGPDYAVTVDGITLNPAKQDQIQITVDGKQVAYQASEQKTVSMTIALANVPALNAAGQSDNTATESYAFELNGADVGTNEVILAVVDSTNGILTFRNAQGTSGDYNLTIVRTDELGQRTFNADVISVDPNDTHVINYGLWGNTINGSAPLIVEVDHGSDGTIDSTVQLQNQIRNVYLPLISR